MVQAGQYEVYRGGVSLAHDRNRLARSECYMCASAAGELNRYGRPVLRTPGGLMRGCWFAYACGAVRKSCSEGRASC